MTGDDPRVENTREADDRQRSRRIAAAEEAADRTRQGIAYDTECDTSCDPGVYSGPSYDAEIADAARSDRPHDHSTTGAGAGTRTQPQPRRHSPGR